MARGGIGEAGGLPTRCRPCRRAYVGSTSAQTRPLPSTSAAVRATKRRRTRARPVAGPAQARRSPACTAARATRAPCARGGVHDDGDHAATAAARARKHVGGEYPAQQLGPRDPAPTPRAARRRRAVPRGHQLAELRALLARRPEHPRVANQMPARWRNGPAKPAEKCHRRQHQLGATVGPRPLEPIRDRALGGPRQPLVRERGPGPVAAQPLERLPIVVGDHDPGVQRETLAP